MMRGPPRPTLFPYTTLFGSRSGEGDRPAGEGAQRRVDLAAAQAPDVADEVEPRAAGPRDQVPLALVQRAAADRKSTRLNSSHANISYAVFCLKKKNTSLHSS